MDKHFIINIFYERTLLWLWNLTRPNNNDWTNSIIFYLSKIPTLQKLEYFTFYLLIYHLIYFLFTFYLSFREGKIPNFSGSARSLEYYDKGKGILKLRFYFIFLSYFSIVFRSYLDIFQSAYIIWLDSYSFNFY